MNPFRRLLAFLPYALLLGAFAWSLLHVARRGRPAADDGRPVIRVGHWLMHAGMRESFDEAIAAYEKIRPDVRVEQIAVPVRTYSSWLRTRLVGGNAPDLTGLLRIDEEQVTRNFIPLDEWLAEPNPHNAGTALEGARWIDTFVDGLDNVRQTYGAVSGLTVGANIQINTQRLYYNKDLLRRVTGSDEPPADFAAFRALGEKVAAYNARTGARITPVASCGPYANYLFGALLPSQTQRLAVDRSPSLNFYYAHHELALSFLRGELGYREPALRASLELMRDVTALMPTGFMQLQRDDALFAYMQQQALMLYAGSWDYGVLVRDGDFSTGVTRLPLPGADHPRYGAFVLGPTSEAAGYPEGVFAIARTSPHPEIALDFLRFLTSRPVAERFTARTHRISAIRTTPPPPDAPELAPSLDGEVGGFLVDFSLLPGQSAAGLFSRNQHLALGPQGDVDAFVNAIEPALPAALRSDLTALTNGQLRELRRLDAQIAFELTRPDGDPARWTRLAEAQHVRQHERLPILLELDREGARR